MSGWVKVHERLTLGKQLSNKLAGDYYSKIKLIYLPLWISMKKRLRLRTDKRVKVRMKENNSTYNLFISESGDVDSLKEVFLNKEYEFETNTSPKVIFDLGSNCGISAIFFRLQYPDAKIYCFEPSPEVFKKLQTNVMQFDNIYTFNIAVSGKDGKEDFYVSPDNSLFSSLFQRLPDQKSIAIEGKTLDSLMNDLMVGEIDILKFDVEGAELEVFRNFNKISQVKYFIGELHWDLIKGEKKDFLKIFDKFTIELQERTPQKICMFRAIKNAN